MNTENTTKEIITNFLINNDEVNHYYSNTNPYKYFNANYPDCILIEIEKGGSSGGNCWNDNPSEPYEKEHDELEKEIINAIINRVSPLSEELNIDLKSKEAKVSFFTHAYDAINNEVREKHTNEYYGNYTTEVIYAINIKSVLESIMHKEDIEIFDSVLYDFILEKKPELLEDKANTNKYK